MRSPADPTSTSRATWRRASPSSERMTRVLVTGGAGFIGSHTCERLLERGDEVVVLDNFNDFYDPELKLSNAARLSAAQIVAGDIRDRDRVAALFREHEFDAVIHLAAMAGVRPSV